MKEVKFKAGDLVYCPSETAKICQLKAGKYSGMSLIIEISTQISSEIHLTADGRLNIGKDVYYIVHATQENYELLSKLYPNVEFEPPPKRKEPKEIIRAMLKAGYDGVPCKTECGRDRYICTGIVENEFFSFQYDSDEDSAYSSGIPYYPKTGQKIIDFVDGEVVLESEDD